jgi:hypothetical protein
MGVAVNIMFTSTTNVHLLVYAAPMGRHRARSPEGRYKLLIGVNCLSV